MLIKDYLVLVILLVTLGAQLKLRSFSFNWKIFRFIFLISIFLISLVLIYWSVAQYLIWHRSGTPTSYFLPPYRSISYFLRYIGFRFWLPGIISLLFSLFFYFSADHFNRKHNGKFFYQEEPYLIALSIFLVGHPLWIFYLMAVLFLWLIISIVQFLILRKSGRISFRYFWLPAAILVILLKGHLLSIGFLKILQTQAGL